MAGFWKVIGPIGLGFIGAAIAIGGWVALAGTGALPGPAGDQNDGSFEQRVREYLLTNPQVVAESVERMEREQRLVQTGELSLLIRANRQEIFDDPATPVGGNPDGDVSLVEFFDYNCPYCRRVAPTLVEIERDDPNLRIVYKEWPILGSNSEFAARAALAAQRQGKYAVFHNGLMLGRGLADEARVLEVASEVGLDLARLQQDMQSPEITEAIARNRDLARVLRIGGTPTFVIGDQLLPGAADVKVIRTLIEQAREK